MLISFIKKIIPIKLKSKIKFWPYFLRYGYKFLFPPQVQQTVIVLGMHRSGTSLVAGILSYLGINMGKNLLAADKFNKKGYYENQIILEKINKKIFHSLDCHWDTPPKLQEILKLKNKFKFRIKFFTRLESNHKWGWKDPRTVFTIDLFLPFLINPHFIICRRNSKSIIKSLQLRNGFSKSKATALIYRYNSAITSFLTHNKYPALEIDFENFFINPQKNLKKISYFLNLDVNPDTQNKILNFIQPNLINTKVVYK